MSMEQIQYFPPERLKTVPQIRTRNNPEIVRAVAQTMREVGQLQAIRARLDGEDLIVVDGHTRLDAAKLAGLATVAVIIEEKPLCEGEVIHRQLIANCQREELAPAIQATPRAGSVLNLKIRAFRQPASQSSPFQSTAG